MSRLVLGRYDAAAVQAMLHRHGVLGRVRERGFGDLRVSVNDSGTVGLTHVHLLGNKEGRTHLLLDACVSETRIPSEAFSATGYAMPRPIELATIYWLREQDPTCTFSWSRPALPLQSHPGLGVLRQAFLAAREMACELQKDGLGAFPKYFHDAMIFHRSRLLLFLEGEEQGRFLALMRCLNGLPLRDATLALVGDHVRDEGDKPVRWQPGFQVMPLSPLLWGWFNSDRYASAVDHAFATCDYRLSVARSPAAAAAGAMAVPATCVSQPSPPAPRSETRGRR